MSVRPVFAVMVAPAVFEPRFRSNVIVMSSAVISGSETFPSTFSTAYLRAKPRTAFSTSASVIVLGTLLSWRVAAMEAASAAPLRMSRCPTRWLWSMTSAAPPRVMRMTPTATILAAPPRVSRRNRLLIVLKVSNMVPVSLADR